MPWIFHHRGAPLWHTSLSMMIIEVCPWNTPSPRRGQGCHGTGNLDAHPATQHLGNNISISFQLLSWKWTLHLKLVDCFKRQFVFLKRCGQFHLTSDTQNGIRIRVLKGCHPLNTPAQDGCRRATVVTAELPVPFSPELSFHAAGFSAVQLPQKPYFSCSLKGLQCLQQ